MAAKFPMPPRMKVRPGVSAGIASNAKPAGRNAKPIPAPGPRPIGFWDDYYEVGTADPSVHRDPGAGAWNSKPRTYSALTQAAGIRTALAIGSNAFVGRNATRHLRHYFGNHGHDLTIDLEDMVRTVPSAKTAMIVEFREAQDFLRPLPPGRYDFTSRNTGEGENRQAENMDWFFAIGGYSRWGKGRAQLDGTGANRRYDIDFTYHFFDRYNWDGGKEVVIAGYTITDEFMGEFHRQGLAKEFDCYGSIRRRFIWTGELQAPRGEMIINSGGR